MIASFYMPTRIVSGTGALGTIGTLARDLKMSRVLVVSDPVISAQPFHADALAALQGVGLTVARSDECGIDARYSHIDDQVERVHRDGIDGIICIGGASVMCTGKAQLPRERVRAMAEHAVPGLNAGIAAEDFDHKTVKDHTVIACPSARKMTVKQAEEIFEYCLG